MDPITRAFLIRKYNLSPSDQDAAFSSMDAPQSTSMSDSPADAFQKGLGMSPGPISTPNLKDPTPADDTPATMPNPGASRSPASVTVKKSVSGPINPNSDSDPTLSDDEMKRYGIRSPEEIQALKDQRSQLAQQYGQDQSANSLAKILNTASDNINSSGNRILAGNVSNSAPAANASLDQGLKDKYAAKVSALDDANKIGDTDYNRLKAIDDNRLKLQELQDTAKYRADSLKAYRDSNAAFKQDKVDNDMEIKYGKAVDPAQASSRSALGQAAINANRTQKLVGLLSQPNITGPDRKLIANEMNTIVSGLSNVSGAEAAEYKGAMQKVAGFANELNGDVNNTLPDAQRQHMLQQVKELQANMLRLIQHNKQLQDIRFRSVLKKSPELAEQYEKHLNDTYILPKTPQQQSQGFNPDSYIKGGQ